MTEFSMPIWLAVPAAALATVALMAVIFKTGDKESERSSDE